jgi:hypothetical protein
MVKNKKRVEKKLKIKLKDIPFRIKEIKPKDGAKKEKPGLESEVGRPFPFPETEAETKADKARAPVLLRENAMVRGENVPPTQVREVEKPGEERKYQEKPIYATGQRTAFYDTTRPGGGATITERKYTLQQRGAMMANVLTDSPSLDNPQGLIPSNPGNGVQQKPPENRLWEERPGMQVREGGYYESTKQQEKKPQKRYPWEA